MVRARRRLDRAILFVMLAACATSAAALVIAATRPWSMVFWSDAAFAGLLAALAASLGLGFAALRAQRVRPRADASTGSFVRFSICAVVLVAIPWFVWVQPFKALWLLMYAGVAGGVVAAAWRIRLRIPRGVEVVLFNVCALALGAELVLRVVAAVHPSPLFGVTATANEVFARYRKLPGETHLGFPCDERGFCDRLVRAPGARLVACIGDSFGFGLVPHALHYTTVAEQVLGDVEIYNASVIAAGPAEYLRLLVDDVLPVRPDAIVVAFFAGNDVEESARFASRWTFLANVFDRERLMLAVLPRRLATLARENAEHEARGDSRAVGAIQGEDAAPGARFPWLEDPMLEAPTMSEATFLAVERRRAAFVCHGDDAAAYAPCFAALDAILTAARGTPIAFVLIPDEFHVEDALWAQVAKPGFERDRPQRILHAWLRERGVAVLDLLPALRAVEPLADGARHVYHVRDTHWNRRGNATAGDALARFLRTWP
ncbi:MAG: hypothetical protein HZB39_20950 [Planctomycetes bacterium]|nr:hypothetical protein [Planctomycetota bacterium]